MTRAPITPADLSAVLRDDLRATRGEQFDEWVEREGFETEAIVGLARFLTSTWRESGENVEVLALMAFTVGWDAHKGLRGERA